MYVLHTVLTVALATAGGLLGAGVIAWLFWTAFRLIHHPQWGPTLAFVLVLAAAFPWLRTNELAQTLLLFSALAAGVGWVSPSSSDSALLRLSQSEPAARRTHFKHG
ncbi:hypothetical protein [Sphingomonas sp. 10B4]|uniref:hypothetical protein n=1 Tax=Sphingomonas sp. 10B4 TaxID=3048575 RepID=UPI002AB3F327|nr:hypothetical protein [Sphingomonas sp. 10B4]MDY7524623.1 hypothetical protein [Sphingomonas sp. 10B4]